MTASAEFRRGWFIVITAMVGAGLGVSSIGLYTSGLFIEPLEQASHWSRSWISSGSAAMTLGIALASPFAGRVVDRLGARSTAVASLLMLAGGYAILSLIPLQIMTYVALFFVMGLLGSASTPLTFTKVVNTWFSRGRGLALGMTLTGSGTVGILTPLILGPVIAEYGWRSGYAAVAAVIAAAAPLVWLGLRNPPAARESGHQPVALEGSSFRQAVRSPTLWIMTASFSLAALGIAGVIVHYIPILSSAGVSRIDALQAASWLGVSVIVSRLCTGIALDHLFAPYVGASVFVAAGFGCLMLLFGGPEAYVAAGILISFAMGTEVDLVAYMVARHFGLKAYGQIFGLLFGLLLIGAGAGPLLFGVMFDAAGDYRISLQAAFILIIAAAGLLLLLRRPAPDSEPLLGRGTA